MKVLFPDNYIMSKENKAIIDFVTSDLPKKLEERKPFHYLFSGRAGVGKTFLADIIQDSIKKAYPVQKGFPELPVAMWVKWYCTAIYSEYLGIMKNKAHNVFGDKQYLSGNLFLDDLGDEYPNTEAANSFIKNILMQRYLNTKSGKVRSTIITTNFSVESIKKKYGDRIIDRLYEHFIIFIFRGESFRKKKLKIIN